MSPPIVTWSISAAAAAATGSAVAVVALTSTTAHSISIPSTKYGKGSPALKALSLFDSEELESLSLSNDSSSIALASLDNLSLDASSSSSSTSQATNEIKNKQTKDHQQHQQQQQQSSSFYKCLRLFPLCILRPPSTGDASKDIYKFMVPEWNGKRASGIALHEVKCGEVVNTFALDEFDYYVFGRQPIHPTQKGTGVLLDHISTSRQHSVIFHHRMHDLSYLVDLDSAHGTFLNGKKLTPYQPVAMANRNVITFGLSQPKYIVRQFPKLSQIRERIINHDAASSETDSQTKFHTCLNSMISYSNISRDDIEADEVEGDANISDSFEIGNMQPCHIKSSSEGNYVVESLKNQSIFHHCPIKRSKSLSFLSSFADASKQGFSVLGRDQSFTSLPSLEDPDAPSYQSSHMKHSRSMSSSRRVSFSINDPEIIPSNLISKSHSTTSLCKLVLTENNAASTPRDTLILSKIKEVEEEQQHQHEDEEKEETSIADIQNSHSSKVNIVECGSSHDESLNCNKFPEDLSKRRSLSLSISIPSTLDIFQSPRKKLCNTTRY